MAEQTVRIPLTGKRGGEMIVDAIDADLAAFKWNHLKCGYACRDSGSRKAGRRAFSYAHRVIAERMLERTLAKGEDVDHIHHNTLDNRRSELRVVQHRENIQHRKGPPCNNTSGFRGVSYAKHMGKWHAYVGTGQSRINVGYFDTAEDAGEAAAAKRREIGYLSAEKA